MDVRFSNMVLVIFSFNGFVFSIIICFTKKSETELYILDGNLRLRLLHLLLPPITDNHIASSSFFTLLGAIILERLDTLYKENTYGPMEPEV